MSLDWEYDAFDDEEKSELFYRPCYTRGGGSSSDFNVLPRLSQPKDYYKILEVESDASDEAIRSNYIRLALKWHPDKKKSEDSATSMFQKINEAYKVLSDPVKRREYDKTKPGVLYIHDSYALECLVRNRSKMLTCNGLGMSCSWIVDHKDFTLEQC